MLPYAYSVYDKWRSRIPTPRLNEWLHEAQAKQAPPAKGGAVYRGKKLVSGPLRIKYVTQPSSRPPTYVMFVNRFRPSGDVLPESYHRYLLVAFVPVSNWKVFNLEFLSREIVKVQREKQSL